MCTRRGILVAFLVAQFVGCSIFRRGGGDDDQERNNYIGPKGAFVVKGGVLYDDGEMVNEAIEQACRDHLGHGRVFMATGTIDPTKTINENLGTGVKEIPGQLTNIPCGKPGCGGMLVETGKRQYSPWGRLEAGEEHLDDDGPGKPPIYMHEGQCNVCLSTRYPSELDEPAPALPTKRITAGSYAGAYAIPLPAGGWLIPRLPAWLRMPLVRQMMRVSPAGVL